MRYNVASKKVCVGVGGMWYTRGIVNERKWFMLKQMMLSAFCALCAAVAVAAPKVRWIPANADIVAVGATAPGAEEKVESTWRAAAEANDVDLDALIEEDFSGEEADAFFKVLYATMGDGTKKSGCSAESMVFSIALPKSADAFEEETGYKGIEAFGAYLFVEHSKLNPAVLAQAVKDLVNQNAEDLVLETSGAWTVIVVKNDEDDLPTEPKAKIAYRLMDGGVVWAFGADDHAMKTVEGILAGTAPGLPKKTPFLAAFRNEISQAPVSAGCAIVKDVTELIKRYASAEEYEGMMMEMPMLKGLGSVVFTSTFAEDASLHFEMMAMMGTATNAEQARDLLLGFKAMALMGLAQELPNADESALMKIMSSITVVSQAKALKASFTVTPEQIFKMIKEVEAMEAAAGVDSFEDEDFDEELIEMEEDDAEELLKHL